MSIEIGDNSNEVNLHEKAIIIRELLALTKEHSVNKDVRDLAETKLKVVLKSINLIEKKS